MTLRANVEVPAIEISDEEVDFGEVQVGHQKTVYVQLHNRKGVPCEWSVVKPPPRIKRPNEPEETPEPFRIVPSRGVLGPDERKNVKVIFAPTHSPSKGFEKTHVIRVENNPKMTYVTTRGAGRSLGVRCEPGGILELGSDRPSGGRRD